MLGARDSGTDYGEDASRSNINPHKPSSDKFTLFKMLHLTLISYVCFWTEKNEETYKVYLLIIVAKTSKGKKGFYIFLPEWNGVELY